jgi:hypothetical protein
MNKRTNSLNMPSNNSSGQRRRRNGSSGESNSGNSQSLSAAEEVSIANSSSLRLMMLQEESEFHLFRQQQTTAGKLQRAAKRERMIQLLSGTYHHQQQQQTPAAAAADQKNNQNNQKRRFSEPDLMRCSVRIIPDAPNLSWEDYRRKRKEYLSSIFYRSAGNLSCHHSSKGFSEYPILLLTTGDDNNKKKKKGSISPSSSVRPGPGPSVVRKLSMTVQSVDRFQAINNRLSEKIQHLDDKISSRRPSSLLTVDHQSMNRSNSVKTRRRYGSSQQQTRKRRYSSSPIHDECCECAYLPLSQTVTLVKVQSVAPVGPSSVAAEETSGGRGQPHWRACMVSGRDSLSCSLNSP